LSCGRDRAWEYLDMGIMTHMGNEFAIGQPKLVPPFIKHMSEEFFAELFTVVSLWFS